MSKIVTDKNVQQNLQGLSGSQAAKLKVVLWEADLINQMCPDPAQLRKHFKEEIKVRRGPVKRLLAFMAKQTDSQLVDFLDLLFREGYYTTL